jgi:hypothetical protein
MGLYIAERLVLRALAAKLTFPRWRFNAAVARFISNLSLASLSPKPSRIDSGVISSTVRDRYYGVSHYPSPTTGINNPGETFARARGILMLLPTPPTEDTQAQQAGAE